MNKQREHQKVKRIFIADPSFQDWIGHHVPYDLSVKHASEKLHIPCEILGNVKLNITDPSVLRDVTPVFSRTAWGRVTAFRGPQRAADFLFISLGLLCRLFLGIFSHCIRECVHFTQRHSIRSKLMSLGKIARWLLPPVVLATARCFKRGIMRVGQLLIRGGNFVFYWFTPPAVAEFLHRLPGTFSEMPLPKWLGWICALPAINEYYELRCALEKRTFGKGDLLFVHMITGYNFALWALVASWIVARNMGGELVFLFRYSKHEMQPSNFGSKVACRLLEQAFRHGTLRGATDSELLAKEYATFLAVPLVVYPIPHLPDLVKPNINTERALTCVSLGNARAEKGILEIFDAIRMLNKKHKKHNIVFELQVNDPDAECREAIADFVSESHANVRMYHTTLTPKEYSELLTRSDVVLVPYHSDIYASRTSGILLEAVAAGKPVVTTFGSWMEKELLKFGEATNLIPSHDPVALANEVIAIASDYENQALSAQHRAMRCHSTHDSERFARMLLGEANITCISRNAKILIVYPFDNLIANKSGSAVRAHYLHDFLSFLEYKPSFLAPKQDCDYRYQNMISVYHELATLFTLPQKPWGIYTPEEKWALYMTKRLCFSRAFRLKLTESLIGTAAVFSEYAFDLPHISLYTKSLNLPLIATAYDRHAASCSDKSVECVISSHETSSLKLADFVGTVSQTEHDAFIKLNVPNILVPNPTDVYKKSAATAQSCEIVLLDAGIHKEKPFLLFVGSSHMPNLEAKDALKTIAREIRAKDLPWQIVVAGSCGHPGESEDNFIALGMVDNEVIDVLYAECIAIVSPLPRGTGSSLKTVEAMARKKAIIGTPATFRGLDVTDQTHCYIERHTSGFVRRLEHILQDEDNMARVVQNAYQFALGYDYRTSFIPYKDFLEQWPKTTVPTNLSV